MSGRYRRLALLFLSLLAILSACALPSPDSLPGKRQTDGSYSTDSVKLLVAEDGVYGVASETLRVQGLQLASPLSYAALRLSHAGEPVPFLIEGDKLIFYGQASEDRYYARRPYILQTGEAGEPMKTVDLPPYEAPEAPLIERTVRLEENYNYVSEAREEDSSDVWFWFKLAQQDAFTTTFSLPEQVEGPATLRLNAWGFTHNPEVVGDHDFLVRVNDVAIGDVVWDGQVSHTAELILPPGVLQGGENRIELDNRAEGASFLDIVQINWLELDYHTRPVIGDQQVEFAAAGGVALEGFDGSPLLLDISDPARPQRLQGWQFRNGRLEAQLENGRRYKLAEPDAFHEPLLQGLRASDWRNPGHQADLIIVTTSELAEPLAPLVQARQAEGLSVQVVPVEEIYDAFGHGAPSPESIRSFVAYAYEQWQLPQARYLLLVGDASSDYLAYAHDPPRNVVPSPMVPVNFSGETVSDSRLADVDGDGQPELAVGRWPAQTAQEVADLVQRTLAYEASSAPERVLFATDGSESLFSDIARRLVREGELPAEMVVQRDGPSSVEIGDLWREGAWLVTYVGHGSIDRWGKEDMFSIAELDSLAGDSAPIVLQLTCLTGFFAHPQQASLAEGMLLHPQGPVLVVAASSLTLSAHQEPFAIALVQQLQARDLERIGDAFLAAKGALDVAHSDGLREISDTFGLFGDPSAKIGRPG